MKRDRNHEIYYGPMVGKVMKKVHRRRRGAVKHSSLTYRIDKIKNFRTMFLDKWQSMVLLKMLIG